MTTASRRRNLPTVRSLSRRPVAEVVPLPTPAPLRSEEGRAQRRRTGKRPTKPPEPMRESRRTTQLPAPPVRERNFHSNCAARAPGIPCSISRA
jgi:hypothetical protein